MDAPVYLDYNATTPVDPAVREAMLPYLGEHFGNPSSSHACGRRAREAVEAARAEVAALVTVMHANNEVGTVQPIAEVAALARARGVLVHSDAAQSVGKIPVDVDALGVDLLTLAGHKFYAPKGVGALYVRRGTPIAPVLLGADHERGLRPGTENVALVVALGAAARLARERGAAAGERLRQLRDHLHGLLREGVPGLALNGAVEQRLPNTLHVSFPGVSGRALLAAAAREVAASVGSACHSEGDAVSGVLAAMGLGPERALGAVRLSVGLMTTEEEITRAAGALVVAWQAAHGGRQPRSSCRARPESQQVQLRGSPGVTCHQVLRRIGLSTLDGRHTVAGLGSGFDLR
jgi:cysteine desulfurase